MKHTDQIFLDISSFLYKKRVGTYLRSFRLHSTACACYCGGEWSLWDKLSRLSQHAKGILDIANVPTQNPPQSPLIVLVCSVYSHHGNIIDATKPPCETCLINFALCPSSSSDLHLTPRTFRPTFSWVLTDPSSAFGDTRQFPVTILTRRATCLKCQASFQLVRRQ